VKDLLAPQPMTKRQVADLVMRVRRGGSGYFKLGRSDFRELSWHFTTRSRCAARYARLMRCGLEEAALAFNITASPIWKAWREMYPGEAWICRHGIGWTSCDVCSTRSRWRTT
jgi:hypothetical protein